MSSNLRSLSSVLVSACCLPTAIRAAGPLSYDDIKARSLQLLRNASFEESSKDGRGPAGWGVYKTVHNKLQHVTDVDGSKHGVRYLTFAPGKEVRYLYGGLKQTVSGKLHVSIWAKGKGRVRLRMKAAPKDARPRGLQRAAVMQYSDWIPVASEKWQTFSHVVDPPAELDIGGRKEKPGGISMDMAIQGEVSLDRCSAVLVNALRKAAEETAAAASQEDAGSDPAFVMPKLTVPPRIDGELETDEWDGAIALTGFCELDSKECSPRQTVVYAGFDEERLYFAFRCPHEGVFGKGKPARDEGWNHQVEAVEVWLNPPGAEWFQFLGWPAGGIWDASRSRATAWNGEWVFANRVTDVPETVGGILTFQKKVWTAEMSIAFSELGVATPKDGETWRINFCRDFSVGRGKDRYSRDWTSWVPVGGRFASNVGKFARATFRREGPVVQMLGIGDLQNGDLSVSGRCGRAPGTIRLTARAAAADRTISLRSEELEGPAPFELRDRFRATGSMRMTYVLTARDKSSDALLLRTRIPFTAAAALRVKTVPVLPERLLYVNVDAARVAALPKRVSIDAEVWRGDAKTDVATSATWAEGTTTGDLKLDIGRLGAGEHQVKVFLRGADRGAPVASSVARFTVMDMPAWYGSQLGVDEKVPAPWTPVSVDGDRVRVTQREYRLAASGLPAQVTALGEELFASAPQLRLMIGGKEVAWAWRPLEESLRKDDRVCWQIAGTAGPLQLEGRLRIEFDGFALWDVTVSIPRPARVDALAMVFPYRRQRALYARGRGCGSACLYNALAPKAVRVGNHNFSAGGWAWPEQWSPEVWVGDDDRGFSVMTETDQYLRGRRRNEITQGKSVHTLTVHLIDGPHDVTEPLRYTYLWQATPVVPLPKDPKRWHANYKLHDSDAFRKHAFASLGHAMWSLKYISYPELYHPKRVVNKLFGSYRKAGVKVVPYVSLQRSTTLAPELKPFLPEWERYPIRLFSNPVRGDSIAACLTSSMGGFMVYAAKRIVDDLAHDGMYLDVAGTHRCSNHYHGCGYWDPESATWEGTVNILAVREVYKRIYKIYKSAGRDHIQYRHGMPIAAVAGFVDVVTEGEGWCGEGKNHYLRLTPDLFRAREMKTQYGVPHTWYVFHHMGRGRQFGVHVPFCTTLAYCLPHRILPTVGHEGMWRLWEVTDQFWTDSEFLAYWNPATPVAVDREHVLASLWLKKRERRALLVVANWSAEPKEVTVTIDAERLGLGADLHASRALKHPIVGRGDPEGSDPMANAPLPYREGKLPLNLGGRNLELLLLESPKR